VVRDHKKGGGQPNGWNKRIQDTSYLTISFPNNGENQSGLSSLFYSWQFKEGLKWPVGVGKKEKE